MHWLWQRFSPESPKFHDKWSGLGYRSMTLPTTTNKFAGKQNVEMLLQQDEEYIKRFVYGEWVKSAGHLFRIDELSVLEYDAPLMMQIQNSMNLGRILDHGDSAPTCCLWTAADGEGNLFVWQEYYQPGITETGEYNIADHRRAITQLSRPNTFRTNLADPSIFAKTRGVSGFHKRAKRWSVSDEYTDRKLITEDTQIHWKPADNNEALSRTRLRQYLKVDPFHRHPLTGELGAPHLYFVKRSGEWPHGCLHAISETRAARRKAMGESDGKTIYGDDRDDTIPDHALDCIRYLVNSKPLAATSAEDKVQLKAYAGANGKVMITVPPITHHSTKISRAVERGTWKSKGGGY
jgi:hypothetical protein